MSEGWRKLPLADVCSLITDGSHYSPATVDDGLPYVTVRDLGEHGVNLETAARIDPSSFDELARNGCQPREGDVLFSKDGTVGKVALVKGDADFVVLSSLAILRPKIEVVIPAFLSFALRSDAFLLEAVQQKTGNAIRRVVLRNLRQLQIPVPPLSVQRRIVDLMEHLDTHIANLDREASLVARNRRAIQAALLGENSASSFVSLDSLIDAKRVETFRGKVISKKTMAACPGSYPVYSSAQGNNGAIGAYGEFMFDEELITWSVDGGGHLFHRPKHRYSVTNIGGVLRILDKKGLDYRFLFYSLDWQHQQEEFDWQHKAHPSVIRKLYTRIPVLPLEEQQKIGALLSSFDQLERDLLTERGCLGELRGAVLASLLTRDVELPESYDDLLGVAS